MAKGFSNSTVRSFKAAANKINKAAKEITGFTGAALRMFGEEIMTDVKDSRPGKGVPVDTGALRSTGRVEGPGSGKKPQVSLNFGGAAAPYALIQHEVLKFKHALGEARYLVRGMQRWKTSTSAAWRSLEKKMKESTSKG